MTIRDLIKLSVKDLTDHYARGQLSPVEVLKTTLDHCEVTNPKINAVFSIRPEYALAEARRSEKRWKEGRSMGLLDGIPVTVKDSVAIEGWPYFHGIAANRYLPESTYTSPPALALFEHGAVIFGKTTMPDCGLMASGLSSLHGITRNPWGLKWNTGGSSAGAGSSLAAGIGHLSVGTDIAGSVRLPAAHCGLASLKPTHGRVPHLPPDTMRMAGPMGRCVDDIARLLTVLTRPDERDTWSFPATDILYHERLDRNPAGLKIGVLTDMGFGQKPEGKVIEVVEKAARLLEAAGANVTNMPAPFDYDAYAPIDFFLQVRGFLECQSLPAGRENEVNEYVKNWSMPGAKHSGVDFYKSLNAITRMKAALLKACEPYDFIISPVMPVVNFPAEEPGVSREIPLGHTQFTALFNQTGQPAATLCMGFDPHGLPISIQIVGHRTDDLGVLQITKIIENQRGFEIEWPIDPRS